MPTLCTVTNHRYLSNAIILAQSWFEHNYSQNVCIYYFDINEFLVDQYRAKYPNIKFINIPRLYNHSYDPLAFWYKAYAIKDCLMNVDMLIYSDATNLFVKYTNLIDLFYQDTLFLPYNNNILRNKYWTTKKCFEKLDMYSAVDGYQYWAGFQSYKSTDTNLKFVTDMYDYMSDPEIAYPNPTIQYPDNNNNPCIFHRNDQSVLSLLIYKYNKNRPFNILAQKLLGDHQTFKLFDDAYDIDQSVMCLSPRHTKHINTFI